MGQTLYVNDSSGSLYAMNSATGSYHHIGVIATPDIKSIICQGRILWAVTPSTFVRINPRTAESSVIGSILYPDQVAGVGVASTGIVYAATVTGKLLTIDPDNGRGEFAGDYGSGLKASGSLAFDDNDRLYTTVKSSDLSTDYLATVEVGNGHATVLGPIGFPNVTGLTVLGCRLLGVTSDKRVLSINAATGAGTVIGVNDLFMRSITYCCTCCC